MRDSRDRMIEVFNGTKWVQNQDKKVMEQVMHNVFYVINKYFEECVDMDNINKLDDIKLKEFIKGVAIPLYGKHYKYPSNIEVDPKFNCDVDMLFDILQPMIKQHIVLESNQHHFKPIKGKGLI